MNVVMQEIITNLSLPNVLSVMKKAISHASALIIQWVCILMEELAGNLLK
jgi:hypothetical protein